MKSQFDTNAAQVSRKAHCAICGRNYYESLVRLCPEQKRHFCLYCCRVCQYHYMDMAGQGCGKLDEIRRKALEKNGKRNGNGGTG